MKIICFTPLPYGNGSGWWGRDLALTVRGFREAGHEAWLSCWATSHPQDPEGRPALLISPREAESPQWWQRQRPDAVVLGLWTMPRYDQIRAAALSATPRIVERCDSDGLRLPSSHHWLFWKNQVVAAWDRATPNSRWLAALAAGAKGLAHEAATPWLKHRLAGTLRTIPSFLVETPLATRRFQGLAHSLGVDPGKFRHVPHPIDTEIFKIPATNKRKPVVVSVGRWQAAQKDGPLLRSSLVGFLEKNPEFNALVFGPGSPSLSPHPRLTLAGPKPQKEIADRLAASEILFFCSRYESFLLAGAEALCCGCSVIGPRNIVSSEYFASFFSGPPPPGRTVSGLADALSREADQWRRGHRHPESIAAQAAAAFSYKNVAQSILSILQEI